MLSASATYAQRRRTEDALGASLVSISFRKAGRNFAFLESTKMGKIHIMDGLTIPNNNVGHSEKETHANPILEQMSEKSQGLLSLVLLSSVMVGNGK